MAGVAGAGGRRAEAAGLVEYALILVLIAIAQSPALLRTAVSGYLSTIGTSV